MASPTPKADALRVLDKAEWDKVFAGGLDRDILNWHQLCRWRDNYADLELEAAALREQLATAHRCIWELPVFRTQSDK